MKALLVIAILGLVLLIPLSAVLAEDDVEDFKLDVADVAIDEKHPLRFVIQASQVAQERLAADNSVRSKVLLKKASRLAAIAKKHANQGEDALSEKAAVEYSSVMAEVDKLGPIISELAKQRDIEALVTAARSHHLMVLRAVLAKVPESARPAIQNAIDVSSLRVNFTHPNTRLACVNQACVKVPGRGDDTCSTNVDCIIPDNNNDTNQTNQTHLACVSETCTLVDGPGADLCSTTADCVNTPGNETNQTLFPDLVVASINLTSKTANTTNFTTVSLRTSVLGMRMHRSLYLRPGATSP